METGTQAQLEFEEAQQAEAERAGKTHRWTRREEQRKVRERRGRIKSAGQNC